MSGEEWQGKIVQSNLLSSTPWKAWSLEVSPLGFHVSPDFCTPLFVGKEDPILFHTSVILCQLQTWSYKEHGPLA